MQRCGDGHRAGCQGTAITSARQPESPPLYHFIDFNRFNDMDVQASSLEVPP